MDFAIYFEQIYEIAKYLWSQIDWGNLKSYIPYIVLVSIPVILFFILLKIISSRRAEKEYIENGVCISLQFPPMGDKKKKLGDLFEKLHKIFYSEFEEKYFFSIEVLLKKDSETVFIYIPGILHEAVKTALLGEFTVKEVTDHREKFIENLQESTSAIDLELFNDFVYPLQFKPQSNVDFQELLEEKEWIFVQYTSRPIGERWRKVVKDFIENLKKGKEKVRSFGCLGGFLDFTVPFFTFIGDTFTSLIHGSSSVSEEKENIEYLNLNKDQKTKIGIVTEKDDKYGFETMLRICIGSSEADRRYLLMDKILDLFTDGNETVNSYTVRKVHNKINANYKNTLSLAFLEKTSVDVLNRKELVATLSFFIK